MGIIFVKPSDKDTLKKSRGTKKATNGMQMSMTMRSSKPNTSFSLALVVSDIFVL